MILGHAGDSDLLQSSHSGQRDSAAGKTYAVTLLTIYIALLMFIPSALVLPPLGGAGSPATLLAVGLMGWYLARWLQPASALDRERQPIRGAAAIFACSILAAYVSANRHVLPVPEQNGADRGLIFMIGWLGVVLLAADGIESWDRLLVLLRRIAAGGTALAAVAITQFVTGLNIATYVVIPGFIEKVPFADLRVRDGLNRPSATAAQPLELAAVLGLCLPIALHQARFAAPGSRIRRWAQVALIAGAMPLTVSRSALVCLAAVAITLLPTWPKRQRRAAYLLVLGAVVGFWLAVPSMLAVFQQLFGQIGAESSSVSRINAYASAVPFISAHPWFGQGFQTFLPQVYFFVDNQYLTSLIETGIVGLLALVGLLATGWYAARAARRAVSGAQARDLMQCLAASVVSAGVSFATFDALGFAIATGLTFTMLGCTGAAWRLARAQWPAINPGPGRHPGLSRWLTLGR